MKVVLSVDLLWAMDVRDSSPISDCESLSKSVSWDDESEALLFVSWESTRSTSWTSSILRFCPIRGLIAGELTLERDRFAGSCEAGLATCRVAFESLDVCCCSGAFGFLGPRTRRVGDVVVLIMSKGDEKSAKNSA